ncbi:MAG: IMP cyclohydrolase [Lentisphaerae bacterium]|jgi:phosphoribosylaminoimidazolecarboxamide formyltransferase/IMP cyclohydrolase|nr:IMP cyclohydrolase [Lentisphaerota bacterium]
MAEDKLNRNTYLSKHIGNFPELATVLNRQYTKVDDLRYGTNPHQTAAFYKPQNQNCLIGDMKVLKTGKSGLSQTNLEDLSYSLNIVKFFQAPACACMKHVNPCGAALASKGDTLKDVYIKARDCDPRAAFGSVIAFNCQVDADTAQEIMTSFVECVVAPDFTAEAVAVFCNPEAKLNKHVRILQCGDLASVPKYCGDDITGYQTMKVLLDGSLIIADPLLTNMRSVADLRPASAESKTLGQVSSSVQASPEQMEDLLTAWYVNLSVRSNGVVIVKNGGTLCVGTGEQDRVGAVEQAIEKYQQKYAGKESIQNAVMASDGFFPFPDGVEVAAKAGITAIIAPSGSLKDAEVVARANELGVALFHAPERVFSHH